MAGYLTHLFPILFSVGGRYPTDRLGEQTGALAGERSCRYPFSLWPPELPGAPGVTVERKMCKQVSRATSWMSAVILEEEILRVHQIARESLDSSPSFVLQKDIIKIFVVPNTLLFSFHFSKSWQSFKVLILFYLLSVKTFLSAPNHGSCIFFQTPLALRGKI